jgi:hypothetical protein
MMGSLSLLHRDSNRCAAETAVMCRVTTCQVLIQGVQEGKEATRSNAGCFDLVLLFVKYHQGNQTVTSERFSSTT